jgi:MFS family permease
MKSGSWASIVLIYFFGVLSSASLSKVIPLQADFQAQFAAGPAQFALLMTLLTIPPALFATVGGSIADRIGARTVLIAAAITGVVANALALLAPTLAAFLAIRVLEGFVLSGVYSAAPALIMATTDNARRGKAMAFWSTYTPVGISTGLLLGSYFTGSEHWRWAYAVHGVLFAGLVLAGLLLPASPRRAASTQRPPGLLSTYAQSGPLRVALTFGALVIMGFGTNAVFPSWYSQHHQVSVAAAASLFAGANLAMIAGGLVTGWLLGRGAGPLRLFAMVAGASLVAAVGLYLPGVATPLCVAALVLWLFTSGAATAVVTSSLPRVVSDPTQGAAAAGLLSQVAALTTFVTPYIWLPLLAGGHWQGFIGVIVVAWTLALLLLPVRGR